MTVAAEGGVALQLDELWARTTWGIAQAGLSFHSSSGSRVSFDETIPDERGELAHGAAGRARKTGGDLRVGRHACLG